MSDNQNTQRPQPPLEKARPVIDDVGTRGVDALRSASKGWQQMMNGNKETRRQRIIREQHERAQAIREGRNPDAEEGGWKPGDDETYYAAGEAPDMRKLMENHKRMQKKNAQKRFFEGTPELVALKMVQLFESAKQMKPEIVSVEESGFNTYKVTYIAD
jgi:hypothetical protein